MSVYNQTPFYFKSIRNITSAFGTLFNNITIVRKDSNDTEVSRHLVPLYYGDKNAWYKRMKSKVNDFDDEGTNINIGSILPVLTFKLLGLQYAPARKVNTLNNIAANVQGGPNTLKKSFAPAPYDFEFQLQAYSKNIEDGLQIVEQIAPFFQPEVNIKIKEMDDPVIHNDIKVILSSITPDDTDEDWLGGRLITWTFDFRVTGNIYPPFTDTAVILNNLIDFKDKDTLEVLSTVIVDVNDL